ncbi:MAG: DUF559 domain-containing protein [Acidaminococcales bacterium]|jgi:very-short-patch-repair endonuclease|nr:DUF559 domain-containing protein [Acidaminococcales bacterium]
METFEKVAALYQYIGELASLRGKVVTDINQQLFTLFTSKILELEYEGYVQLSFQDSAASDETEPEDFSPNALLRVKKPDFQICPRPSDALEPYLMPGWHDYRQSAEVMPELPGGDKFAARQGLKHDYDKWVSLRGQWVARQRVIASARALFMRLFNVYTDINRETETQELMVGNGVLRLDDDAKYNHPILLKRVAIHLDAAENVLTICDTDNAPELYASLLSDIADINHSVVKDAQKKLLENYYHPMDRVGASDFIKAFTHRLSGDSKFIAFGSQDEAANSRLTVSMNDTVFFVRKKIDGTSKAIEAIIGNIERTKAFPTFIGEIVSGGTIKVPEPATEADIGVSLAKTNGENPDILLSKSANREQLEIAERIERYNAVLVQGPPGTGKTHTIANLLGHFLARGNSVLVTSYAPKALSVIYDKIPEAIRPLCVTVTSDDNSVMAHSVDGISDYMDRHNSDEMAAVAETAAARRNAILRQLEDVRKKLFMIRHSECRPIVFSGNEYSVKDAASFVYAHSEDLSYIPGKVTLFKAMPVSIDDLEFVYKCNGAITTSDEQELETNLPNPRLLPTPTDFSQLCDDFAIALSSTDAPAQNPAIVKKPVADRIEDIANNYILPLQGIEKWATTAAADGKRGGGYRRRWEKLCSLIEDAAQFSSRNAVCLTGRIIDVNPEITCEMITGNIPRLKSIAKKGKLSALDFIFNIFNKEATIVFNGVKINGKLMSSGDDLETLLAFIEIGKKRDGIAPLWNELPGKGGAPEFNALGDEPENIAIRFVDKIRHYLDWHQNKFPVFKQDVESTGLSFEKVFPIAAMDTEQIQIEKLFQGIVGGLPKQLKSVHDWESYQFEKSRKNTLLDAAKSRKNTVLGLLSENSLSASSICKKLKSAVATNDKEAYRAGYAQLETVYAKYEDIQKKSGILGKIRKHAPKWAEAIEGRQGVHGASVCPDNIEDAWKWKQFAGIIDGITAQPFESLQKDNALLSVKLREATAELAANQAWFHLLRKTESNLDMRQALQGWKLTVKKIGKGTGKKAPLYRRRAREQMSVCLDAVPAWIMPIGKALDSLNPAENKFDVIIVDEASQCDLSSLGILYMAKKAIIVGDDKQVSPLAVGIDVDRVNALMDIYIDKIPNHWLYDAKASLYDIALTTFQPLMLREHFRCLPDIIGYSNKLSYDYKIKPLRDAATAKLAPQVVNYRVSGGARERNKTNPREAQSILSLIAACIEQPEYSKMTFGVISLLGDQQAQLIQTQILKCLPASTIEERRMIFGNASHFQGDERDVIFLSLVDSNEGDGPLRMTGDGIDASTKQRYNVAASRAKEQLWVVHSLDCVKDLKPGDIRRDLLEYAHNPSAYSQKIDRIMKKSDSAFEEAVAKTLTAAGYTIVQQYQVGSAYRIDMAVSCGNRKIALECDGEAWHSSEYQIRSDMERQAILERIGWTFIRIRGSEYYRHPQKTMEGVFAQLRECGIVPENNAGDTSVPQTSALLERVKTRAAQLLDGQSILAPLGAPGPGAFDMPFSKENEPCPAKPKNGPKKIAGQISAPASSLKDALNKIGAAYIDKRATGGSFLWVLDTPDAHGAIENALQKYGTQYCFEKRGSVATEGKPAWRVKQG